MVKSLPEGASVMFVKRIKFRPTILWFSIKVIDKLLSWSEPIFFQITIFTLVIQIIKLFEYRQIPNPIRLVPKRPST